MTTQEASVQKRVRRRRNEYGGRNAVGELCQALGIPFKHAESLNEYGWFGLEELSLANIDDLVAAGVPPPYARKIMNAVRPPQRLRWQ